MQTRTMAVICSIVLLVAAPFVSGITFCVAQNFIDQNFIDKTFPVQRVSGLTYRVATRFDGGTDTLKLNLWMPVTSSSAPKPLVMWVHGGGFSGGSRDEFDSLCSWYAQRGYIAVTPSYRLGFYTAWPLDYPFPYDEAEIVRACYRAVQDVLGCMEWLKQHAGQYTIDTSRIAIGGGSAGGITIMHAAYVEWPEYPAQRESIAPVTRFTESYARPDLGSYSKPLRIRAAVNIFGALLDTAWLDSGDDIPLYQYHQANDGVVPCGRNRALWNVPLVMGNNYPVMYGSCAIQTRLLSMPELNDRCTTWIYDGSEHAPHDIVELDKRVAIFLAENLAGNATSVRDTSENDVSDFAPSTYYDILGNMITDVTNVRGCVIKRDAGGKTRLLFR